MHKQYRTINILAGSLLLASLSASLMSLRYRKYEMLEVCFQPPITTDVQSFCNNNQKYLVSERLINSKAYSPSNQRYKSNILPEDVKVLRSLGITNPNYLVWGILGTVFSGLSYLFLSDVIESLTEDKYQKMKNSIALAYDEIFEDEIILNSIEDSHKPLEQSLSVEDLELQQQLLLAEQAKLELEEKRQSELENLDHQLGILTRQEAIAKLRNAVLKEEGKLAITVDKVAEFKRKLKEHEGGWLWDMVRATKSIYFVGGQGSYKTNLMSMIAMLDVVYKGYFLDTLVDPHLVDNHKRKKATDYPGSFEYTYNLFDRTYGANLKTGIQNDYKDVARGIEYFFKYLDDLSVRRDQKSIFVFDEFTKWKNELKVLELDELIDRFTGKLTGDPRKAGVKILIGTHQDSNAVWGANRRDSIEANMMALRLESDIEQKPTFKGSLYNVNDPETGKLIKRDDPNHIKVTIPVEWFNADDVKEVYDYHIVNRK